MNRDNIRNSMMNPDKIARKAKYDKKRRPLRDKKKRVTMGT